MNLNEAIRKCRAFRRTEAGVAFMELLSSAQEDWKEEMVDAEDARPAQGAIQRIRQLEKRIKTEIKN